MRMVKEHEPQARRRVIDAEAYWRIRTMIRDAVEKLEAEATAARDEAEGEGNETSGHHYRVSNTHASSATLVTWRDCSKRERACARCVVCSPEGTGRRMGTADRVHIGANVCPCRDRSAPIG